MQVPGIQLMDNEEKAKVKKPMLNMAYFIIKSYKPTCFDPQMVFFRAK